MLLFILEHTRPDLSNSTRELLKVMDKATEGHMKELCRVIKYAIDTKNKGLKLRPENTDDKWKIEAYSDADFAGDKETRISVTGYVIFFYECTNLLEITWTERCYIIHNRSGIRSM